MRCGTSGNGGEPLRRRASANGTKSNGCCKSRDDQLRGRAAQSKLRANPLPETLAFRALTPAQLVQEGKGGALILDTRPPEQFAACNIRGSIHISLQGYFSAWAAILIDREQKLVLISEDARYAEEAHLRLARVGLEHVLGYSFADEKEWRERGIELASMPIERCESIRDVA